MSAATASRSGASGKSKKANGKKKFKKYAILTAMGLVSLVVVWAFQPIKGTINFGICKVFVEQSVRYPSEMTVVSLLERPTDVRMEYTIINEFGDYAVHSATCVFTQNQNGQTVLKGVLMDRQKVDPKKVAIFNLTIPLILANPPDLVAPLPIKEEILDLKR